MRIHDAMDKARIVACCGSGGVGKTTVSAALGIHGALSGRKTLVLTIDPARRLADALGLSALDHRVRPIPKDRFAAMGLSPQGSLSAMMLDTRHTLDRLVERYAPSPQVAEKIFANRYYQHIAGDLTGSHEYMAMEKLNELYETGAYDLIVVDTPPSRHALDFLDAPRRLVNLLTDNLFWKLARPYARAGLLGLRMVAFFTSPIYKAVGRVLGNRVITDLIDFFKLGDDLFFEGFARRSEAIRKVLSGPETCFVAVTTPQAAPMREAIFFYETLKKANMPFGGFIVNRVHPHYPPSAMEEMDRTGLPPALVKKLAANYADFQRLGESDAHAIARLAELAGPDTPIDRIPVFEADIHDFSGLARIHGYLEGGGDG